MNKLTMLGLIEPLIVFHLGFAAGQAPKAAHHIAPTPQTVTWGYFDPRRSPALRVHSGDTVEVEALIAAGVQDMELAGVAANDIQPALLKIDRDVKDRGEIPHILTGPIYVQGAEPDDVLEVRILSIDPVISYAVNFFRPGRGFLENEFPYAYSKVIPLDLSRKVAKFSKTVEIPLRPFFGVIGVAPPIQTGRISSGPPWIHAGNMDNKELVAGTTLYIPVHVEGALLSIGDGHAGQGDGEV